MTGRQPTVLIVDDEQIARRRLARLIGGLGDLEIVGEAADVAGAVDAARKLAPDLILLDIAMPGGDGFDVVERLGTACPTVVFVTAFDHHAIRAFEVAAVDYLTKPVEPARLATAIARARAEIANRSRSDRIAELLATVETLRRAARGGAEPPLSLWAKHRGVRRKIALDAIVSVKAERDYVLVSAGGQTHLVNESLAMMQRRLAPFGFLRVHRSSLVRSAAVVEIRAGVQGGAWLRLTDGTEWRIGRTYAPAVRSALGVPSPACPAIDPPPRPQRE